MKTKEQLQAVVNEILEVCEKHRVMLIGTCEAEGIYGEITIEDTEDISIIRHSLRCICGHAVDNKVVGNSDDGFSVRGIGMVPNISVA